MLIVTTDTIPGRAIRRTLGLVVGASVRSAHLGDDVASIMQNWVGGEMHGCTKIMAEAREQALDRLRDQTWALGGNAVIGLRFCSAEIASHAAELLAYGTAVDLAPEPDGAQAESPIISSR
ncbi:MAG: hypothetical protein BWZ10_02888 [candidate division BRC1 bacterium ADurb.BinA364]|nr:MAG: hypothetical protein BWZ10_02888 [candidate division BRC1 bacterium ADurb.BinA364]